MFWNLFKGLLKGEKAGDNPWSAATLEWQIPSPPSTENFEKIPVVNRGPYDFKEYDENA
jgi:cytochrome c oxidase subunit 1